MNRCTKEGVNGEKLASIPKFGLEIKNRCRKQPIFSTHPQHAFHNALTTRLALDVLHRQCFVAVRQWRQKRVLMRPEAAFPYVFAAEGAQHPPIGRHALRSPPNNSRSTIATQKPAATKKGLYIKKSPVQCLTESDFFVWSL